MFGRDVAKILAIVCTCVIRDGTTLAARGGRVLLFSILVYFSPATLAAQSNELAPAANSVGSTAAEESRPVIHMTASGDLKNSDLPMPSLVRTSGVTDNFNELEPTLMEPPILAANFVSPLPSAPKPSFQLKRALLQEFEYLAVEHGFRLAQDQTLRSQLIHSRFFHNWAASLQGYDLKRWGDGDSFLVNDIAHPMQGAVAGWIFLQNSPVGSTRVIGKDPQYWTSRLKAMGWAAAYEVQWKIGPLSESSIGNAGGWEYVPGCGIKRSCLDPGHYPPPTNNTGLSDWIMTPVAGLGWIIIEDTIDKYIVGRVGEHNWVAGNVLRSALEPTRNFAAILNGVLPWDRRYGERRFIYSTPKPARTLTGEDSWRDHPRSAGVQFVSISLPQEQKNCAGCRHNYSGIGFPYGLRIFEHLYFDSEFSYFPGNSSNGPTWQGLFGTKFGYQASHWGMFAKVRPGFIYYQNAWSGGKNAHFTDLSRFALDSGGTLEFYPNKRSAIRLDFGTTLVRYLQDYPFPRVSEIGSLISTDDYVTQGNFQFSTGYRIRF